MSKWKNKTEVLIWNCGVLLGAFGFLSLVSGDYTAIIVTMIYCAGMIYERVCEATLERMGVEK